MVSQVEEDAGPSISNRRRCRAAPVHVGNIQQEGDCQS